MPVDATVVVPTFRNPDGVAVLLAALEGQELARERFEVVIVDNGGTPETNERLAAVVAGTAVDARLLRIERNAGPAPARNLGWKEARGRIVAYLDDDVTPSAGWLSAGLAAFDDPAVGVVQGRTSPPADAPPTVGWTVVRDVAGPTPWFEACNLFFLRDALATTGGFDETMGFYGEDTAAGWGVLAAGWTRGFAAEARVVHENEQRGLRWFLRHAYLERNLVEVAVRYPAFRAEAFWRPWALRPYEPALALAAVGAVLAVGARTPVPLALGLPYAWLRRSHFRFAHRWRNGAENVLHDAYRLAGHLEGSARHRTVAL